MNEILNFLSDVPQEVWAVAAETVIAALVASPLVAGLKKWLSINSDKVALVTTIGTSMFAAAAVYAATNPVFSAWLIPVHGWLIFAATQPVYRFLVKPVIAKVQSIIAEAIAFNSEVKSAAVPPTGIPTSGTTSQE